MAYADVLELNRRQPRRNYDIELPDAPMRNDQVRGAERPAAGFSGAASALGYLGAAPLVFGAIAMIAQPAIADLAQRFLVLYGAALIIFFGGVRWGVAVMRPGGPTMRALLGAGLPLLAALPLFAPGDAQVKMVAIMTMTALLLLDDLSATRRGDGAPGWYLGVRLPLTVLIEVAFLVALAASLKA